MPSLFCLEDLVYPIGYAFQNISLGFHDVVLRCSALQSGYTIIMKPFTAITKCRTQVFWTENGPMKSVNMLSGTKWLQSVWYPVYTYMTLVYPRSLRGSSLVMWIHKVRALPVMGGVTVEQTWQHMTSSKGAGGLFMGVLSRTELVELAGE